MTPPSRRLSPPRLEVPVTRELQPAALRSWPRAALWALVLIAAAVLTGQRAAAQTAQQGHALFQAKCVACHTIGHGTLVGPDLAGVTSLRTHAWLMRWIQNPDRMLANGDPTATQLLKEFHQVRMPNLGLDQASVASLVAYLAQAGKQPSVASAATGASAPLPPGNALAGKALFTGVHRFRNGGPPCMGCHSVAGIGALGGGALGPDLTGAEAKYNGLRGLTAFLAGTPTPTMNAVWSQEPLTATERANVVAFLSQAPVEKRPVQAVGRLIVLAVIGWLLVLGLSHLVWRHRLRAVRSPMVAKSARHRT